jgi:flagellar basal-body rod modification protein FlgD
MAAAVSSTSSQVSQNEFLQLMIAQLKSQDPLNPTDSGQYLAQLAQFQSLSDMQQLNSNFSDMLTLQQITQGSSLIGKTISYVNSDGSMNAGKVTGSGVTNGNLMIQVNNDSVQLSQITGVSG